MEEEFHGNFSFVVDSCLGFGCTGSRLDTQSREVECINNLADLGELNACQFGRDFCFLSFGALELNPTNRLQLLPNGNVALFDLPTNPPLDDDFIVSRNECDSCCLEVNREFDGPTPDDVERDTCRSTCITKKVCFDNPEYPNRFGCAVALDFLQTSFTEVRGQFVQCINGNVSLIVDDESNLNDSAVPAVYVTIVAVAVIILLLVAVSFRKRVKSERIHIECRVNKENSSGFITKAAPDTQSVSNLPRSIHSLNLRFQNSPSSIAMSSVPGIRNSAISTTPTIQTDVQPIDMIKV